MESDLGLLLGPGAVVLDLQHDLLRRASPRQKVLVHDVAQRPHLLVVKLRSTTGA